MSSLNTKMVKHRIDVQAGTDEDQPSTAEILKWAELALGEHEPCQLCIRTVGRPEIQSLNQQFRQKDKPTNVLSFPADPIPGLDTPYLGDIALCASVINQEALTQKKQSTAHWAHMVIHGTLHLLGFDHESEVDAEHMESQEILLLQQLSFPNPYEEDPH